MVVVMMAMVMVSMLMLVIPKMLSYRFGMTASTVLIMMMMVVMMMMSIMIIPWSVAILAQAPASPGLGAERRL